MHEIAIEASFESIRLPADVFSAARSSGLVPTDEREAARFGRII